MCEKIPTDFSKYFPWQLTRLLSIAAAPSACLCRCPTLLMGLSPNQRRCTISQVHTKLTESRLLLSISSSSDVSLLPDFWGCRWSFALTLVEKSERRRHYCITSQGEEHRTGFLKPTVMVVFLPLSINMLATWWEPIIGGSRAEPQQYHLGLYHETSAVINLCTQIISPNTNTIVAVARQYRTNKGPGDAGMLNG